MATKNWMDQLLTGQAAADASNPMAATPRGGVEFGFSGESDTDPTGNHATGRVLRTAHPTSGPWLEDDDQTVFRRADWLVLRQEQIAINRLAQDEYFTYLKRGAPFVTLEKDPKRSTYRCILPKGMSALTIQAVPNLIWDLVNKATETILVDPPEPSPTPLDDSEQAIAAAEMAGHFLDEDGGPQGTNDLALFYNAVDKALACSTAYLECWVDPTAGGYVPLQILAHPEAQDPANPMLGPDGMPTTDPVLRYVTAPQGGQFTDDPSQAAPQWQPKLRGTMWCREHWRVFPEDTTVEHAHTLIGLLYCTVGEAKERWPDTVGQMSDEEMNALASWTPVRYLSLLPPFMRARWNITVGDQKLKNGTGDERILFFYKIYEKASPEHPKGAEVVVSGAAGGTILHRALLAMNIPAPNGQGEVVRCMEIPVVQVTPRADPDDRDPTGYSYIELFAGASEFNATLVTGFLEAMNIWLHPDSYIPSTSPVQGFQVAESRASGTPITILRPEDKPVYGNMPPLPPNFWQGPEYNIDQIRSIASLNKPVTGDDSSKEVSGRARQIAVQQAMVALNRMQQAIHSACSRWWRIKIERSMQAFDTTQQLRYVGEDGSYEVSEWTGTDFALIGGVEIAPSSGTMMPPEQKVNYIATIAANGLLDPETGKEAANQIFRKRLGIPDDPHRQYIERCVATWLKGPPSPDWATQWQSYMAQMQQYQQVMQQYQQQQQAYQQALADTATVQAGMPQPLGPEQQNQQAALAYSQAALRLQTNPLTAPPPPPQVQLPVAPWTPFQARPNDAEPPIAAQWMRRLSAVISSSRYDAMPPEWRQPLDQKYQQAVQIVQQAQAAQQQGASTNPYAQGPRGSEANAPTPSSQPAQAQGATQPTPPQVAG